MAKVAVDTSLLDGNSNSAVRGIIPAVQYWANNINNVDIVQNSDISYVNVIIVPQNQYSTYSRTHTWSTAVSDGSMSQTKATYVFLDTNQQYYTGSVGGRSITAPAPVYDLLNHELLHGLGYEHDDSASASNFLSLENQMNLTFDRNAVPRGSYSTFGISQDPNHARDAVDPSPLGTTSPVPDVMGYAPQKNFTDVNFDESSSDDRSQSEPRAPAPDEFDAEIQDEQEQLRQQLQEIEAILNTIDEDAFLADGSVIDSFLDALNAQLDGLDTLNGSDLLDRLRDLIGKLDEWRDYFQSRMEMDADFNGNMVPPDDSDDPQDDRSGNEREREEWEEQPPTSYQADEHETEPEYAWSDSDPQRWDDDRD